MFEGRERRRAAGSGLVTGLGLSFLVVHVTNAVRPGEDPWSFALGFVFPTLMAATLTAIGILLLRGRTMGSALRVGAWSFVGATTASIAGIIISLYQISEGATLTNVTYVISNVATYGGIMGVVIGMYNARHAETQRRLDTEQHRASALGNRLSVLNRVLRHDIRTNVTIIQGNATQIIDDETDHESAARTIRDQAADLYHLSEQARRLEQIIAEEDPHVEAIDVARVARTSAADLADRYPDARVETDLPETAVAAASPMIDAAVENLVRNGVEHDPEDPHVTVTVTRDEDAVELTVRDRGPGIPANELAVLERGEETDLEHASGLGLWLTNWVVSASGGTIDFSEPPAGGTAITIELPRAQASTRYQSANSARNDPTTR